jgi:hypothetical protein
VLVTADSGKSWEIQPGVTSKVLQAVVHRGGNRVWIAGRGGTMLKRTHSLTPRTVIVQKGPPVLKFNGTKVKPKPRSPLITITDDGDIPSAVPIKKAD